MLKRIFYFFFNVARNLSLLFVLLTLPLHFYLEGHPEELTGIAKQSEEAPSQEVLPATSITALSEHRPPTFIRVGGKRQFREFQIQDFQWAKTDGSHYVNLSLRNQPLVRLNGNIKHIAERLSRGGIHIYHTGSWVVNLASVRGVDRDALPASGGYSLRLRVQDGGAVPKLYTLKVPRYRAAAFMRAWNAFRNSADRKI